MSIERTRAIRQRTGECDDARRPLGKQRLFALPRRSEDEDERVRAEAERAIRRVLFEWGERENGRLPKIPTSVEELVRFHCVDYERRARALTEHTRRIERERAERQSAFEHEEKAKADIEKIAEIAKRDTKRAKATDESATSRHRHAYTPHAYTPHLRVARKTAGRRVLSAPTAAHYRRLNMLVDLAFSLACEEGVRSTMRADVAARRGDRRTSLYYVDRRAYLAQKRQAKLALAAAFGLL